MSRFREALIDCLGKERLQKIEGVKVGIAGAGGLGSNIAQCLVRSGFTQLTIVDFDKVDYSNLNRQFYFFDQVGEQKVLALKKNLHRINPNVNISIVSDRLDERNIKEVFSNCKVVVEAFDNAVCKKMLMETFINSKKLIVSASGIAGWGKSDDIKVRQIKDNFYLVGDMVSEVTLNCPPVSPRVNVVAAKQADVVLSWVLNNK